MIKIDFIVNIGFIIIIVEIVDIYFPSLGLRLDILSEKYKTEISRLQNSFG